MKHPVSQELRKFVDAIVAGDHELFSTMLKASPELAMATFSEGATRQNAASSFLEEVGQYIYSGDTALHIAAAAYRHDMVGELIKAGANVRARNRRGGEPLHAAASGSPVSPAQVKTIIALVKAGADPNAQNMDGATPLHRAVRTRCADAVGVLLDLGANPAIRNKNGSTAMDLASRPTGRSGSGSDEAKAQQAEILVLLEKLRH